MDLYKLLKSLEEFLYEIIVLLVFYPRTLYLSVRFPQRMMDYADTELGDVQSGQYTDTVSPPLFLMITLGVTYLVGIAVRHEDIVAGTPALVADPEKLLVFRVFTFSLLPLFYSLRLLGQLGIKLDRDTLRPPFFSQCFVTAPYAMVFGLGLLFLTVGPDTKWLGIALLAGSSLWYIRQQAQWFATKRGTGLAAGWRTATSTYLLGWAVIVVLIIALVGVSR